jgi:hypothetical protein
MMRWGISWTAVTTAAMTTTMTAVTAAVITVTTAAVAGYSTPGMAAGRRVSDAHEAVPGHVGPPGVHEPVLDRVGPPGALRAALAPGAAGRAPSSLTSGATTPSPSLTPGGSKVAHGTPGFSVDPSVERGRPGDRVTLSFASDDPGWAVIVGCEAGFGDSRAACSGSPGSDWSVELTVPADAEPGPVSIPWRIFYGPGDDIVVTTPGLPPSHQDGVTPFVVLPPAASPSAEPGGITRDGGGGAASAPPSSPATAGSQRPVPASNHRSSPIGVPLLVAVLLAAAALTLAGRRRLAAAGARALAGVASVRGTAPRVRVVPRPSPVTGVSVDEGPADHTHVVRIVPHHDIGTVEVREVRR